MRFSANFFVSNDENGKPPEDESYENFIETYLYYFRLFDNAAFSVQEIMDMPYCLYQDIILKQIDLKKQEQKEQEKHNRKSGLNKK